jgi:hypothetical protein
MNVNNNTNFMAQKNPSNAMLAAQLNPKIKEQLREAFRDMWFGLSRQNMMRNSGGNACNQAQQQIDSFIATKLKLYSNNPVVLYIKQMANKNRANNVSWEKDINTQASLETCVAKTNAGMNEMNRQIWYCNDRLQQASITQMPQVKVTAPTVHQKLSKEQVEKISQAMLKLKIQNQQENQRSAS